MNRKEFRLINTLIILIFVGFAVLTVKLSSNQSLVDMIKNTVSSKQQSDTSAQGDTVEKCTDKPSLQIGETTEPHLVKLKKYQEVCDSYVSSTLMYFTSFPQDTTSA